MKSFIAAAAFVGSVAAWGNSSAPAVTATPTTYVKTDVVTSYTTYCPFATSIVQGNQTYIATSATTLTITNCPCTLTRTTTGNVAPSQSPVQSAVTKPYTTSTTQVVTSYTTFCPSATTVVQNNVTYTATASQTLTITACPCTLTSTAVFTPGVPVTSTGVVYKTSVMTSYTTVCPSSTTFVVPGPSSTVTYTATPSQTVTVTNAPTTSLVPVSTTTSVFTPAPQAPTSPANGSPAPQGSPAQQATTVAPAGGVASTGVAPKPTGTGSVPFTGGAAKIGGGFLAGAFGLVAALL